MKIKIITIAVLFLIFFDMKVDAQIQNTKVGIFDLLSDIGSPSITGYANYNLPSQTYRIGGSGSNIWYDKDAFSFLSKKMSGNFIVQTQIRFIGEGQEPHRKTGVMLRSSKSTSSAMIACTVHGDGLTSFQYRKNRGDSVQETKLKIKTPDVIQIEKKGNTYIMSVAKFGETYQTETLENINIGDELMAGLFVCSHNDKFSEEVEFSNTRIYNIAPDSLVQYKEYLGSMLEVMDIETGHRQIVGSSTGSWQAPNWTPNGKTLIYNSDGLLYNFDLSTKESSVINTDFATENNNDHVISPDGKYIGISHHASDANGQSTIYTLPATGGNPKKITTNNPSYFHGWSPDNKYLAYTGERNGKFDIYKIPSIGGKEIQLTKTNGLDDGSEYSPDGKYIYFCSTRTGTMQIWRMDADGDNQTQLTFDEYNDWFPHVSPDNKWIVFVSFPKEVPADKHPFYERVYIRLMPIDGGDIKVLSYLYGGQGTINVPSWSPDSKKISFVSNGIF